MYLSHEVANWVCNAGFTIFVFIRFYVKFLVYDYYYFIEVYILPYLLRSIPPVSCSYHIIPYMFSAFDHLLSLYLLIYVCTHDTVFQYMLMTRIYRYTCAYPCTPFGIRVTTVGEF